jgi:hypothetical protein
MFFITPQPQPQGSSTIDTTVDKPTWNEDGEDPGIKI